MSKREVAPSTGTASVRSPSRGRSCASSSWYAKTVCTSGEWLLTPCRPSRCTICSNGTSWWSSTSRQVRPTARTYSRKVSPARWRARNGTVLTKKPTSPSRPGWWRPATGVPITRSCWPVYLCSVSRNAESIVT
ncbi:hypothetical protein V3664_27430 [Streptomyces sp. CS62]